MSAARKLIAARIKAECSAFHQVEGAVDVEAALRGRGTYPAAFVVPSAIQPQGDDGYGGGSQLVRESYGIVIAVRNVNDPTGSDSADVVAQLITDVRNALLGWRPTDDHASMTYGGGRLVDMIHNTVSWQEIYHTITEITVSGG